jgi:hypothetical protein
VAVAAQEKGRKAGVHWGKCIREEGAPLVVALMITGKDEQHEPFARRAMDAFWAQTYPSKVRMRKEKGKGGRRRKRERERG